MQQNALLPIKIVAAGDLSANIAGPALNIQHLDNVSLELIMTTSNAAGQFNVQASLDHSEEPYSPGSVINAGNWVNLSLSPSPTVSGGTFSDSTKTCLIDMNELSFPWVRVTYTASSGTGTVDIYTSAKQI